MLYIITINYNSSQLTIELLTSLSKVKTPFRLILVDNASAVDDIEKLSQYVKEQTCTIQFADNVELFTQNPGLQCVLLQSSENRGFSAGNNLGIRLAQQQPDFEGVILLNNDTEVAPNFLDEINQFRSKNAEADVIGCRIFYANPNDVLWYDGGMYFNHSCRSIHLHINKRLSDFNSSETPTTTGFITGCCMFVSKKCLDSIGLLDESLFMYNEDLEFCIRAQKNGFRLYYVPTAVIWHKIKLTYSPFSIYWGARNRFKVAKKHTNALDYAYTVVFYLVTRIPRFLVWLMQGRVDLIRAQTKGMVHGLRK